MTDTEGRWPVCPHCHLPVGAWQSRHYDQQPKRVWHLRCWLAYGHEVTDGRDQEPGEDVDLP